MERREFLKAVFGCAAGLAGAAALAAAAQAGPLVQPARDLNDLPEPQPQGLAEPAVATQDDLAAAAPEPVRWRYRRRRYYYYRRPRYYVYRRRRRRRVIYYW